MKTRICIAVGLFVGILAYGQQASQELQKLNEQFRENYTAGRHSEALGLLDRMLTLPETSSLPNARGALLYNKACVHALLEQKTEAIRAGQAALVAGYSNWKSFFTDPDFDALRDDREFRAFLTDMKARLGPKPLRWDDTQRTPEFPQKFEPVDSPELARMRNEFQIDAAVAGAEGDYDRLIRLTRWTSRQWKHDSSHMASRSDPITILREARAGGRFICQNYAIVLAGAARAYGLYARHLGILPVDVETRSEAHSVVEVWLPAFGKWALADAQYGIVPELNGRPLNGLELQKALAEDAPIRCRGNEVACREWQAFIITNLYYFKIGDDQRRFGGKVSRQLVLVPKGAKEPHKFAGGNEEVFAGAIYTGNPASFYAPPSQPGR